MPRKSSIAGPKFTKSSHECFLIRCIARRARALYLEQKVERDLLDIEMDLSATHANGNPLRLADLSKADDFNLLHDVAGIARHLDRNTGKLTGHFRPRFTDTVAEAKPSRRAAAKRAVAAAMAEAQ